MSDFDPSHDYFEDLKDNEKYQDDSGREYPKLNGLQRLAHRNRKGVVGVESVIEKTPSVGKVEGEHPDCIASVTVTYHFGDGTFFSGSADASYKAHEAPFNLHLTAVAESKAEARAIRRAFMIGQVSKEEVGSVVVDDSSVDDQPISDAQIQGIRKVAERKGLSIPDVIKKLKLFGRRAEEVNDIEDLTRGEAAKAMKALNRTKRK